MRVPFLLGRLLFGGFFVMNGINHFKQARQLSDYAASRRVPKPALMAVEEPWPVSVPIARKPARGLRRLLRKVAA